MADNMPKGGPIANLADLQPETIAGGDRFAAERRRFTPAVGAVALGCSHFRVPAGKTAFPRHRHHANEEALYVLAGHGTLRLDDARHELRPGDYVALPAGGPAHQLMAGDGEPLEYLCMSTMVYPEVVEYPDSEKVGMFTGAAPGGDHIGQQKRGFYKRDSAVEYYEGE